MYLWSPFSLRKHPNSNRWSCLFVPENRRHRLYASFRPSKMRIKTVYDVVLLSRQKYQGQCRNDLASSLPNTIQRSLMPSFVPSEITYHTTQWSRPALSPKGLKSRWYDFPRRQNHDVPSYSCSSSLLPPNYSPKNLAITDLMASVLLFSCWTRILGLGCVASILASSQTGRVLSNVAEQRTALSYKGFTLLAMSPPFCWSVQNSEKDKRSLYVLVCGRGAISKECDIDFPCGLCVLVEIYRELPFRWIWESPSMYQSNVECLGCWCINTSPWGRNFLSPTHIFFFSIQSKRRIRQCASASFPKTTPQSFMICSFFFSSQSSSESLLQKPEIPRRHRHACDRLG